MRAILFRGAALTSAIGVAIVVASGGRSCGARERELAAVDTGAASQPTASAAAATAPSATSMVSPPRPIDREDLVIGPSTKADPHAIRRAVNGLATTAATSAPVPPAPAQR